MEVMNEIEVSFVGGGMDLPPYDTSKIKVRSSCDGCTFTGHYKDFVAKFGFIEGTRLYIGALLD